ncbi:glycerophosphodiester phosphodiesterase [Nocardioides aurantiacus]|uniref:glycerophosphodiester phosphodiesterase n=1 Tax=Nocardioides aurantiacus TaxID=86796 RepID=A0A3N2CR94_9ACTN|nr:glycerophosphodiester phosphodiesterase [Nocardioides aurantiacus]ROR90029.1 glycerophosphoryl diester phosphodiesterase [Nocardioides aurantiacus]
MTTLGKRGLLVAPTLLAGLVLALLLTLPGLAGAAQAAPPKDPGDRGVRTSQPLVIGHRGASGYRPEHTLAAYQLAIEQGADYVEPDLVPTKDGVLVARHENEIGGTTDVAEHPEFAARRTTKTIDGRAITGWFTEDFTLAELKTLRAEERLPLVRPANTAYDGQFEVPTLTEVLDLVRRTNDARPGSARDVGVYTETKHPTYFQSIGLPMERTLVETLRARGFDSPNDKVFLQSFETTNLRQLDRMTKLPIIQLLDGAGAPYDLVAQGDPRTYRDLTTPRELRAISSYAAGIGPNKELVLPRDASGRTGAPSPLVRDAHRNKLVVHPFTLRRENQFMAVNFRRGTDPNAPGDLAAEIRAFLDAGVDGLFTDNPDIGVATRDAWVRSGSRPAA